jgi:predicted metalloprotease with PDZ domain
MRVATPRIALAVWVGGLAAACAARELAPRPPPLLGLEEPLELVQAPDDERERLRLPPGCFTGIRVGDARASLDAMLAEPEGLEVVAVVENSPAHAAGVEVGDLLLEVERLRGGEGALALRWPSEWRHVELEAEPGDELRLVLDRAGAERECTLTTVARVRAAERGPSERLREEARVGVVLRTATEVEARAAGLGPGAGAVVVGLTRESPWRKAGIAYGDLIRAVDGVDVAHPAVVLDRIRAAPQGGELELALVREGSPLAVRAPVSRRAQELTELSIPLVFRYEKERDRSSTSILLGFFGYERTPAAWRLRLLWLLRFAGGDADRLESLPR